MLSSGIDWWVVIRALSDAESIGKFVSLNLQFLRVNNPSPKLVWRRGRRRWRAGRSEGRRCRMSCAGLTPVVCMSGSVPLAVMLEVAGRRCGRRAGSNSRGKGVDNGATIANLLEGVGLDNLFDSTA